VKTPSLAGAGEGEFDLCLFGRRWWSRGQRACLLLRRRTFKFCLHFDKITKICVLQWLQIDGYDVNTT